MAAKPVAREADMGLLERGNIVTNYVFQGQNRIVVNRLPSEIKYT